jgi:hypothetical protein
MNKSQWQISDRFIVLILIPFGICLLAVFILPAFSGSHKLRGNSKNLLYIRHQIKLWKNQTTNSPTFDFFSLPNDVKSSTVWSVRSFDGFFKTNFSWQNTTDKNEIIIVSAEEFQNVHKHGFWNSFLRNPAHAVGYSDGTVGLISPMDFSNLNLNGFVSAASLVTNSEFNIFK